MAGENPHESTGNPWEFNSKSLPQKAAVVLAGPFMNAFLAFLLFSLVCMIGQPRQTTTIQEVVADYPAQKAGLLAGDRITAVNGKEVVLWEDLLVEVRKSNGPIAFSLDRAGQPLEISVTPDTKGKMPVVGVIPSRVIEKKGFFESFYWGGRYVWEMTKAILFSLRDMITGALPFKDSLAGPIGIFVMTGQAAHLGLVYLLSFTGSLSVSLFVLNLLPIPVLDGGHLLFIVIEKLKGSPLRESIKDRMTQGGLVLLLALMAFVIVQDLSRLTILQNLKTLFAR